MLELLESGARGRALAALRKLSRYRRELSVDEPELMSVMTKHVPGSQSPRRTQQQHRRLPTARRTSTLRRE